MLFYVHLPYVSIVLHFLSLIDLIIFPFQERIQGIKYELLDVRRTHFYCWVHWKYETKSQQKPLLSTHLGGQKAHGNQGFSAVVDGVAE